MKRPLDTLPCCTRVLSVQGEFAIEICCGLASLTLGLVMSSVPCLKPWDAMCGEAFIRRIGFCSSCLRREELFLLISEYLASP